MHVRDMSLSRLSSFNGFILETFGATVKIPHRQRAPTGAENDRGRGRSTATGSCGKITDFPKV